MPMRKSGDRNYCRYFPTDQKLLSLISPLLWTLYSPIPKGQMVGLVGPDGAGKTTLMRLIAGLLKPSQGKISVAGHDTIKEAEFIQSNCRIYAPKIRPV